MRIPFGVPAVSDAAKLGLLRCSYAPRAGERLYQLLNQQTVNENFANLTAWAEADSDGDNIYVSGNKLYMNGSANFTTNGVVLTAGISGARESVTRFNLKMVNVSASGAYSLKSNATLAAFGSGHYIGLYQATATTLVIYAPGSTSRVTITLTTGATYTAEIRMLKDAAGAIQDAEVWISGGTEYAALTRVFAMRLSAALAATVYPHLQRGANDATNESVVDTFQVEVGYATDGPTLTYVADAGAGKLFNGFVPTNLAAIGSWVTTNVTFAYSFDDGVASYSAEKTLAQLNAEAALTTNKRYIRLRITVNSDGATQQYAGELNADDGTGDRFTLPTASTILTGTTINTVAGSATEESHTADEVLVSAGGNWEDTNLGAGDEANVAAGVAFGLSQTGTAAGEVHTADEVLDTALVDPGNVALPLEAEVEFGVFFGPGSLLEGELQGAPIAPDAPTGLAIVDLGTGKGGKATITNSASFATTDELIVTDGSPVTEVKASYDTEYSGVGKCVLRAKVAGVAGNSITVSFESGGSLAYVENGTAITVTFDAATTTTNAVMTKINAESTLIDAIGDGGTDLIDSISGQLANGVDAFTPTVIGRGTFAEYAANSGIFCPNVALGAARTGDKAKAASGLTSASESAYSSAAAAWTPTDQFPGGPSFNGGFN